MILRRKSIYFHNLFAIDIISKIKIKNFIIWWTFRTASACLEVIKIQFSRLNVSNKMFSYLSLSSFCSYCARTIWSDLRPPILNRRWDVRTCCRSNPLCCWDVKDFTAPITCIIKNILLIMKTFILCYTLIWQHVKSWLLPCHIKFRIKFDFQK